MVVRVSVVVGNPRPRSRTLTVATRLAEHLLAGQEHDLAVIDLADHGDTIFSWPSDELSALNARVAESDLVVFASPTYKATYTGLLKAFLDRYPAGGLAGVVAVPLLTAADQTHSMGPTHTLLPLLAELGAVVPGRGLSFVMSQFDRVDEVVEAAASEYRQNIQRVAGLAPHPSRRADAS